MILVVGGTGRLGSRVVAGLLARGHRVRVLARGRRPVPAEINGAELVAGSVATPADLERAVAGVDLVISAVTGFPFADPARVDLLGNERLFGAAERVGADLVLLSVAGAAPDSPADLFRAKFAAEQALARSSVNGTVVRPDGFADLWIELLASTAGRSHRPMVFGRGDNAFGWVAVGDVAALVLRVVEDPSLRARVHTLLGPEPLTLDELARRVMTARGWSGEPRHLPVAALRLMSHVPGRPGRQAGAALAMDHLPLATDDARTSVPDLPSTSVDELLAAGAR